MGLVVANVGFEKIAPVPRLRCLSGAGLHIDEMDALAAPEETAQRWQEVEALCPDASPFVRWPWIRAWLLCYGALVRPRLITLGRAGRRVGVALVSERTIWRHGLFRVRQLCLNTAGEVESPACLEYNRLLVAPAERAQAADALLGHLAETRPWDELLLDGFLEADLPRPIPVEAGALRVLRRRPCFAMDLEGLRRLGRLPEQALSGNTRQQLRRSLRLFGGREGLLLEQPGSAAQAREFLAELADLHQLSWRSRGEPGVFGAGRLLRFLNLLVSTGFPDSVQLLRLRARDGETLGISFNLLDRDTVYYYQSGLRRLADPRCKPGLCLHLLAMEQALAAGRGRYEFMASDLRYKQSLSNVQRTMLWAVVERPRLRLLLERLAQRAVQTVRGLRAAGGPQGPSTR